MTTIEIQLPDDVLTLSPHTPETLQLLAREALLVRLYEQGLVTTGWAAQALGISRRAFLQLLGQYGVSEYDDAVDVASEAAHG